MIDLKEYGFTDFYEEDSTDLSENNMTYARIIKVNRELYTVVSMHGEGNARMKGSFYNNVALTAEDFPAVGDFVLLRYNTQGESQIVKVCRRKSKFSRPDYTGHAAGYVKTILEQVVAANFDYVFIMVSLNYDFNINRILRYITVAWESGGTPVVLLTKADLIEDYSIQMKTILNQAIGIEVIAISAVTGLGMEQLGGFMKPGITAVFLGSSGVGKSTLVNALAGEDIMKVNEIREDDSRGRHTTTHRELIRLNSGVMIIDTPGMRELGMWDIGEGLGETFSDVKDLFTYCKFSNCSHKSEPGCAVQRAIADGTLERSRWNNYLQIKSEIKYTEDKTAYLRERKDFSKKIQKDIRARYKAGGKKV